MSGLSRRGFLGGVAAGGLVLLVGPGRTIAKPARELPSSFDLGLWLAIAPDGLVTIVAHRSEMGQGARTSLPVIIADELGADWSRVRLVQAGANPALGNQNTDGSRSVRNQYGLMRDVGVAARLMLIGAAAKRWRVPASQCVARDHQVVHPRTKRTLGFGALAADAARLPVPKTRASDRRPDSELRYVGTSIKMADLDAMVTGAAIYGQDVRLPGMKYAVIARPPVYGGKATVWNREAALAVAGVEAVIAMPPSKLPSGMSPLGGIAVVAKNTWAALEGRRALAVTWDHGANASYDSTAYRATLEATAASEQKVERERGDVNKALAAAARVVKADYYVPHLAHAPMEPPVATARPTADGGVEVWAPTQAPQGARDQVAASLGVAADKVVMHVTLLGGGFGRKSKHDFSVEAAWLAQKLGAPVKVTWTRQDDVQHGYYHAASAQHLEAGLDASGKTTAWLHRTAFPPIGSTFAPVTYAGGELGLGFVDNPYDVANMRLENGPATGHVRIGWFRSVGNIHHAFAVSSFADELAHAAGRDPRDYLLELIGPARKVDLAADKASYSNYGASIAEHPIDTGRLRQVIERAAKAAGWGGARAPRTGLGIAGHRSFLAYVAAVVEVEVDERGALRVPRVFMAVDAGTIVNPDRVRSQMEGAVIMGLSNAMHSKITATAGRVDQRNFLDYEVLRMMEAPEVTVDIIASKSPPAGIGEPGVPPVAPALCNAIFAATGVRVRSLPVSDHDLA